jgi:hypothetical protein
VQIGSPNSKLKISCAVQNGRLQLGQLPKIENRIGIDLNPIDLNDSDEVLWPLSLVWPNQVERVERLKSAIQILKSNPVKLIKGDANSALPMLTRDLPANLSLCVMHSFTFNQFSVEARESFEKMLCSISAERDVWRMDQMVI